MTEYLPAIGNHLWQSTAFACVMFLLTLALRQNRAQVRYRLWLAASVKFLIPFSLLATLGSRVEWHSARLAAPPLSLAIERISQPFAPPVSAAATPAEPAGWTLFPALPALVWLCGSVAVVGRWWVRWRRVQSALAAASRLPIAAPVGVMASPTRLEPGVVGIFRPVLLLPEGIAERLTAAQFQAILAHEFCHVRRRDNLAAAIHMVVEAIFWLHPLVWWVGGRLVEERERACDEEVLRLGSRPEEYAAGILCVCRFYLESPLACAAGVTGADLRKRIEAIMTKRTLRGLTPARQLLLAVAGIAAIAGPIVVGIVNAQTPAVPLRFEVASIKPAKDAGGRGGLNILPGGGLRMDGATLNGLIALAYDVRETQISGGPKWSASDAYNIVAKPERSTPEDNPEKSFAPGSTAWDRLRLRLQTLLAERFQLAIRTNSKVQAGFALVVAKGGPKLTASTASAPPGTMRNNSGITGRNGTMPMLATVLSGLLGSPVENRTGLTGNYDYRLEYAPDHGPEGAPPSDLSGPSVFAALQEQLGLKLETSRVTTQTIVVERAQKPSAD